MRIGLKYVASLVIHGLVWACNEYVARNYNEQIETYLGKESLVNSAIQWIFAHDGYVFPSLFVLSGITLYILSKRSAAREQSPPDYNSILTELSITQKRILCELTEVSSTSARYRDLIDWLGLPGGYSTVSERKGLERAGLVTYKDQWVYLADAGWDVASKLRESGECEQDGESSSIPRRVTRDDVVTADDAILYVGQRLGIRPDAGLREWAQIATLLTDAAREGTITVYWSPIGVLPVRFHRIDQSDFRDLGFFFYKFRVARHPIAQMNRLETVVGLDLKSQTYHPNPSVLKTSLLEKWPPKPSTSET